MLRDYDQNSIDRMAVQAEWRAGYEQAESDRFHADQHDMEMEAQEHYQADMAARAEQAAASIKLLRAAVADLRKQARQAEYLSTEFNRLASAIVAMEIAADTMLEVVK